VKCIKFADDGFRAVHVCHNVRVDEFGPLGQVPVARCGQARAEGALAVSAEDPVRTAMLASWLRAGMPWTSVPQRATEPPDVERRHSQRWVDEQCCLVDWFYLEHVWPPSVTARRNGRRRGRREVAPARRRERQTSFSGSSTRKAGAHRRHRRVLRYDRISGWIVSTAGAPSGVSRSFPSAAATSLFGHPIVVTSFHLVGS